MLKSVTPHLVSSPACHPSDVRMGDRFIYGFISSSAALRGVLALASRYPLMAIPSCLVFYLYWSLHYTWFSRCVL
ncbi:hypothetical protein PILCRDRAFT_812928 [Piloderma croceum F 1598]|uniref:Uncharacterized protein n=1 Tax=Piloderma croceum (strain F 1598) TaxID=765440 RepID=A0A0C3GEH6_PILCF|nr:hypothetical protein PILCRDRAFT_812928 [Piloderma croceum F 1598]